MLAEYLLRLSMTSLQTLRKPKQSPLDEVSLSLRIWPSDIDIWGHVNNGKYLTLMDQGRLALWANSSLWGAMRKHNARGLVASAAVKFHKEVKAFDRCTLTTQIVSWDEKALYILHQLKRSDTVCASAIVRVVNKVGRKTLAPAVLLEDAGVTAAAPKTLEEVQAMKSGW